MGKFVGIIHQHDYPKDTSKVPAGAVWECECGVQFYTSTLYVGWNQVNPKTDIVTLDPKE